MSGESFENWVEPVVFSHIGQNRALHLEAPNLEVQRWLESELAPTILGTAKDLGLDIDSVSIDITPPDAKPAQVTFDFGGDRHQFNDKYTFDRFIVGSCNEFAHAASTAVATNPAKAYNPLYVYSGVGMGKTHLLQAIGQSALSANPLLKIIYVSAEEFMNEMIKSLRINHMRGFHERFRSADMLLVDDIQVLGSKERTQEEFFHTFNALHNRGKQIVISSDSDPNAIPGLVRRLKSRFSWGLMADIQPPDLETKMAILDSKSKEAGISLPADVRSYMATHLNTNIRELEGLLNRLIAKAQFVNGQITLSMVRSMIQGSCYRSEASPTIDSIKQSVAAKFEIQVAMLSKQSNSRQVARPRQVAMYLCRCLTNSSLISIGKAFQKHHTTVLHSINKIQREIETDNDLKSIINSIQSKL